jgi:hypothetical protein
MQLLASSGVTMAAGAMISLSFVVSPPFTLPPPRAPVDASGNVTPQQHPTRETAGAVTADTFERRWQAATDDIPSMPVPVPLRDPLEGLIGGLSQDALQVTQIESPRDPLEGLIGGLQMLPLAQDVPQ